MSFTSSFAHEFTFRHRSAVEVNESKKYCSFPSIPTILRKLDMLFHLRESNTQKR